MARGPPASRCQCTVAPIAGALIGAGSSSAHLGCPPFQRDSAAQSSAHSPPAPLPAKCRLVPRHATRGRKPYDAPLALDTPGRGANAHLVPACRPADREPVSGSPRRPSPRPRCAAGRTQRLGSGSPHTCAAAPPALSPQESSPIRSEPPLLAVRGPCRDGCLFASRSAGRPGGRSVPLGRWRGTAGSRGRSRGRPWRPRPPR